ncbi:MAG TPA: TIGR01244 family sulfur transferase [Pseudomonadales bacterium]
MEIRKVSDEFSVSGQLTPEALPALKAAGVRTLICNRPDREAPDQPDRVMLEERARALGMEVHYLPVVHDTINARNVEDFAALLRQSAAPVHAWCRSGLRSITLYSLSRVKEGADPVAQVANAAQVGFDFRSFPDKFAPVIAELQRNGSR